MLGCGCVNGSHGHWAEVQVRRCWETVRGSFLAKFRMESRVIGNWSCCRNAQSTASPRSELCSWDNMALREGQEKGRGDGGTCRSETRPLPMVARCSEPRSASWAFPDSLCGTRWCGRAQALTQRVSHLGRGCGTLGLQVHRGGWSPYSVGSLSDWVRTVSVWVGADPRLQVSLLSAGPEVSCLAVFWAPMWLRGAETGTQGVIPCPTSPGWLRLGSTSLPHDCSDWCVCPGGFWSVTVPETLWLLAAGVWQWAWQWASRTILHKDLSIPLLTWC